MSVISHNLKVVIPYRDTGNQNIYEYHLSDGSILEQNYICKLGTDVDAIALNAIPLLDS